ncbi:MAG: ATP-dependent sacrificial sulfur transferase LarE [Actinomycetota bacterium]|nr:ATP-dependent sacrificial sulfur transferase LarE [Actinomycetota bacterium]
MSAATTSPALADHAERLTARIADLGSAVVAFSGGVDSSLVAALAARALGDRALAVTAVSPALASGELAGAQHVAAVIDIAHETIATDELRRSGYRRNGLDRCYHCKSELYDALQALAESRGFRAVLSGANADDASDWRPGLRAAAEHGVIHPLLEARVGKTAVRALAEALGVPSARKVASPCLASRIPYGTPVKPATLSRIDTAERAVRALGYAELRVRHHGSLGRVEIAGADLARACRADQRVAIERAVRDAGYERAELSEEPLRSGSLNPGYAAVDRSGSPGRP